LLPGTLVAAEQTKVSIAYRTVTPNGVPVWIAQERGLFAKQGLDARILHDVGREALGGDVPFGVIGTPAAIEAVSEGRDLKVLAALNLARGTGHLVAQPAIKTPDALRGKRVGVISVGTGFWVHTILALNHLGLEPKRDGITFVELGPGPASRFPQALEDGRIDAVVIDPGQSAQLKAKGVAMLLDMSRANILGVQSVLVVAGAYARQHPEVVEKVVAALVDGIGFSLAPQNEETVRKTLMSHLQVSATAALDAGYRNFMSRANRKPYVSVTAMRNMQRVMALNDPRVSHVKIEDLVDDRFVRKLDDSGAIDRTYQGYGVK
jgi:ABC-type nitrate/sulfonate/bicarbonate transport system substrate-binding protein